MTQTVFVDLEVLFSSAFSKQDCEVEQQTANNKIVDLLSVIAEYYEVVVFSTLTETHRMEVEEWLTDNDIGADELLLRSPGDYTKDDQLRFDMVLSHFNEDEVKCLEKTAFIMTNYERSIETFRENGFIVCQWEW